MPYPRGVLSKPNAKLLGERKEEVKDVKPPKKWFNAPSGGSSAFSSIMRQEMTRSYDKGPKKADQEAYKDL
jgi:hypothetical protein